MASPPVLHVAGFKSCGFYRRVVQVVSSLTVLFPTRIRVQEHEFEDRASYRKFLIDDAFRDKFDSPSAKEHSSSPFCWFSSDTESENKESFLGGHDDALEWCRGFLNPSTPTTLGATTTSNSMLDDGHTANHGYDYDLVVIGGGSGGMAASKEAADLGAKVACLDFVKPSPAGTTWGLGGTCVNVGCIPKKLFHIGSMLKESIQEDGPSFGMNNLPLNGNGDEPQHPDIQHSWEELRENVINYIRSLNFKYRVRLREKNVTYLNKLGRFVDKHTLEVKDKKGKLSQITSSRFLIAVGGRPTPLACPGGELAISSDDVFSLEKNPGKTLCVGASYISLECAGFLAGLGIDTTVAVRSILLRGFDRECADKIDAYMVKHGVKFKRQVTPAKLEQIGEKIKVTFSDGTDEEFDTVLGAIGRTADTEQLGLDNVGVDINPKNKKILGKLEQSVSAPNIYAVGDVLEGSPELTPVAIQAGIALARRLFGGSKEPMDYINVCTTVFTPIEYSCVGYSEDDAIEKFGLDNIEVYHREFLPLEWSISHGRSENFAFAKVITEKEAPQKVLGIHYLGPQAGEVMQGYGAAIKCGLTFEKLSNTVGIHPTSSEELVTLSVTKASGEDAAAGGC
ncbi:Glutathione reductase, chloroplastic (Fragment) [Seminavis robusta]|uniref:thioredoxin-disulfide reductase (NADPH) n=1 Tax=Seminavis robusta TaxID=568900 RepID=A0A9N8DQC2_9STRA